MVKVSQFILKVKLLFKLLAFNSITELKVKELAKSTSMSCQASVLFLIKAYLVSLAPTNLNFNCNKCVCTS